MYSSKLMSVLLLAGTCIAQVSVDCSPQTMAATRSIKENVMGQWGCWVNNNGATPYTLTPAKFYSSIIKLRPVTPAVAQQVISDSVNRLPQSTFVRVGRIVVTLGGIAASIYMGDPVWALATQAALTEGPKVIAVISGEVPSTAPFIGGQLTSAITLPPGGDTPPIVVYAMKTKKENLIPFSTVIQ